MCMHICGYLPPPEVAPADAVFDAVFDAPSLPRCPRSLAQHTTQDQHIGQFTIRSILCICCQGGGVFDHPPGNVVIYFSHNLAPLGNVVIYFIYKECKVCRPPSTPKISDFNFCPLCARFLNEGLAALSQSSSVANKEVTAHTRTIPVVGISTVAQL